MKFILWKILVRELHYVIFIIYLFVHFVRSINQIDHFGDLKLHQICNRVVFDIAGDKK